MKLTPRYTDALAYALAKHADQVRKGGTIPYAAHLLSVSALVMESGADEDLCIAALLHDVVEDCGGMPVAAEVRARYGDRVTEIVLGCSDSTTDDPDRKPDWRTRKVDYLAHVTVASDDVRRVSCADKLHNARCILADYRAVGDTLWQRFTADRASVLWYYRGLVDAFAEGTPPPHLDELRRVVDELGRLVAGAEG